MKEQKEGQAKKEEQAKEDEDLYPYLKDEYQLFLMGLVGAYESHIALLEQESMNPDPSKVLAYKMVLSTVRKILQTYEELKQMDLTYRFAN